MQAFGFCELTLVACCWALLYLSFKPWPMTTCLSIAAYGMQLFKCLFTIIRFRRMCQSKSVDFFVFVSRLIQNSCELQWKKYSLAQWVTWILRVNGIFSLLFALALASSSGNINFLLRNILGINDFTMKTFEHLNRCLSRCDANRLTTTLN